jgi:hypothetical protein
MLPPATHQKLPLADGSVLVVKMHAVCQVSQCEVANWNASSTRFQDKVTKYYLAEDSATRLIAGLIYEFSHESFCRDDVVEWAAYVNLDRSPQDISNALAVLKGKPNQPVVQITDGGPGATWHLNRQPLRDYLESP